MNFFLEDEHRGISAVIYDNNTIINHSDVSGKDIMLVHNAIATNPVPGGILASFKHYKVDANGNIVL